MRAVTVIIAVCVAQNLMAEEDLFYSPEQILENHYPWGKDKQFVKSGSKKMIRGFNLINESETELVYTGFNEGKKTNIVYSFSDNGELNKVTTFFEADIANSEDILGGFFMGLKQFKEIYHSRPFVEYYAFDQQGEIHKFPKNLDPSILLNLAKENKAIMNANFLMQKYNIFLIYMPRDQFVELNPETKLDLTKDILLISDVESKKFRTKGDAELNLAKIYPWGSSIEETKNMYRKNLPDAEFVFDGEDSFVLSMDFNGERGVSLFEFDNSGLYAVTAIEGFNLDEDQAAMARYSDWLTEYAIAYSSAPKIYLRVNGSSSDYDFFKKSFDELLNDSRDGGFIGALVEIDEYTFDLDYASKEGFYKKVGVSDLGIEGDIILASKVMKK